LEQAVELTALLTQEQQLAMLVVRQWLEESHKEKQAALNNRALVPFGSATHESTGEIL
jgi:hypothetical protein